jgi:hypothetical protein
MPFSSSAFGLSLRANRPIPGLPPQPSASSPDTQIWLDPKPFARTVQHQSWNPWYVSGDGDNGCPLLRVWRGADGGHFRLLYHDGVEFIVAGDAREVWVTWPDSSTLADAATYLLGPVLGFMLRLRGVTCLHASAVAVGTHAFALVGPAHAGKSTTAAAFAALGHSVLADDIVALTRTGGTVFAQPAYPQLRLWPESAALLYGAAAALPPLTPNWDKRALDLTTHLGRFQQDALPLAVIYVLAERSSNPEVRVEGLRGREALMTLIANTYVSYLLDPTMREREFDMLGQLVANVPVRRIIPHADSRQLSRLCAHILADYEAHRCTASLTTAR